MFLIITVLYFFINILSCSIQKKQIRNIRDYLSFFVGLIGLFSVYLVETNLEKAFEANSNQVKSFGYRLP
jgi:hypothetical protein